jgi:MFS family permease
LKRQRTSLRCEFHVRPTSPFHYRDYRFFWSARLASTIASTMLVVVIGIHVYDIARASGMSIERASFWLGMVGLAQFLPLFLLTLVAGYVADRIDRRWIVRASLALEMLCAAALALLVWMDAMTLAPLFAVAVALGIGRAFAGPALSSFRAQPRAQELLPSAIASIRSPGRAAPWPGRCWEAAPTRSASPSPTSFRRSCSRSPWARC